MPVVFSPNFRVASNLPDKNQERVGFCAGFKSLKLEFFSERQAPKNLKIKNVIKCTYLVSQQVVFISFDHNNHNIMCEELTGLIDNLHILLTRINYSMDATELCSKASLPLYKDLVYELCQLLCFHLPAPAHPLDSTIRCASFCF